MLMEMLSPAKMKDGHVVALPPPPLVETDR